MITRIKAILIMIIASVSTSGVQAALLSSDLNNTNDGLITIDTSSQLEWLDLTATNGISVVDVANGYGGYFNDGFRYATQDEVLGLYTNAGITGFNTSPFYHTSSLVENFDSADLLISLIGCTSTCEDIPDSYPYGFRPVLSGFYGATPNATNFESTYVYSSYVSMQISSSLFPDQNGTAAAAIGNMSAIAEGSYQGYGSFLVRDASSVSEPSTWLLFGLGMLGIYISRAQRK